VTHSVIFLAALLGLSAFFSGAEAALFALDSFRRRQLRRETRLTSRWLTALLASSGQVLTALLVGNTLVNVAFSVVGTSLILHLLPGGSVEAAVLILTLLVLVVGEVTPKTVAVNFPLTISRLTALPLRLAVGILRPVAALFFLLSQGLLRLVGLRGDLAPQEGRPLAGVVREVLRGEESGVEMSAEEQRILERILEFSGTTAEEIMTPRVDMISVPLDMPRAELERTVRRARHSRIPVYREDPDHIVGFLQVKELFLYPDRKPSELVRPVVFFPETTRIDQIFLEVQRSRVGMVIVVNEFGETMGLITKEDLIEEIVGEIYDEFERAVPDIQPQEDGSWLVRGGTSLESLNEQLGLDLPVEESVTLNGLLCDLKGEIPREGDRLRHGDLEFEVLEVTRHRVQKVRIRRRAGGGEEAGS
jgi:putative hemolysin